VGLLRKVRILNSSYSKSGGGGGAGAFSNLEGDLGESTDGFYSCRLNFQGGIEVGRRVYLKRKKRREGFFCEQRRWGSCGVFRQEVKVESDKGLLMRRPVQGEGGRGRGWKGSARG